MSDPYHTPPQSPQRAPASPGRPLRRTYHVSRPLHRTYHVRIPNAPTNNNSPISPAVPIMSRSRRRIRFDDNVPSAPSGSDLLLLALIRKVLTSPPRFGCPGYEERKDTDP